MIVILSLEVEPKDGGEAPPPEEVAAVAYDILADVTKHERKYTWRVTSACLA